MTGEDVVSHDLGPLTEEYTLLGELGRGGNAIVYKARDRALLRDVAIKVVRPRFAGSDDEAITRLEREARTVARLQHPNIVAVHAVRSLPGGGLGLVMQLIPGRTLKQAIENEGPFSPERVERVLTDIAQALAFAHANGVVHRDVKPENVFLDSASGRAMLSDFGIAHSNEFDSRLTMTGAAIGTPAYMAPEQIDGAPANARSDVYSLGLVGWEMLTGMRPWAGEALYHVIYKQKHEDLPAIDSLRPGQVPERLQYIVERMLQKRPGARWAGADGVLAALESWVVPADWKQWQESHRRRREREKSQERAPARRPDAGAEATVVFTRPTDATPAFAPDVASDQAALVPAAASAQVAPVDYFEAVAPSWASEAEATGASRWRRWVAGGLAFVVAAGTGYGLYTQGAGPFARRAGPVSGTDIAAGVELPIVKPVAPGTGASLAGDSADGVRHTGDTALAPPPTAGAKPGDSEAGAAARPSRRVQRDPDTLNGAPASVAAAPPVDSPPLVTRVAATDDPGIVAAGGRHSCALVAARVLCWGANDRGQLGDGDLETRSEPTPIVGELDLMQVTTGLGHSCGVARGGDAYCWGADDRGQLGDATLTSRSAPVRVAGNRSFRVLRAGQNHTCGLTTDGEALCWGANTYGQLGDGSGNNRAVPTAVAGGLRFVALSAGWNHSCGVVTDGGVYCWGANANGQLGNGGRGDSRTPVPVQSNLRFTAVAAGSTHTCAVSDEGAVYCWGRNTYGQLGTGGNADQSVPAPVYGTVRFASVTAGGVHSCARTRGGAAYCWGRNVYGQLGDGTTTSRDVPTRVTGPAFAAVHASGAHTCAATADRDVWCWGFNVEGQLGDGTRNHLPRPTRVSVRER